GQVAWAAKLDPWGNVLQEYNPQGIHQAIRLPGQHHDRETGLYYNRHRYYDPVVGSYINQDPIGLMGGWNLSGYSEGSPLNYFDPVGLATKEQVDTAVNVLKGQFPEILKTPKSVTGVVGLSGTLGQVLAGRTDLSGNIQYNADIYGEDGVSMCDSKLDDFLQTMAHEMQHLNESVFDRIGLSTGQLLNRISPKFSSIEDIIDHNADIMYQPTINKYKSIINGEK
ncbi:RHS repeat-associated core domain-containing protein, partial [Delftia tsuruhatensis]|uniref:RHS repeat-associated core domain-containing protein n=1 Tax=Delftia tsuruhatensis TaxID=180282 RepID=UPI002447F2B6